MAKARSRGDAWRLKPRPSASGGAPGGDRPCRPKRPRLVETKAADPFDEIDFGSYFDDYLDPGYKSPASENVEKPSFETFLSSPVTLSDHLHSQLALVALSEGVRDAAESIIGNLDENGYLMMTPEEIAASEGHRRPTGGGAARRPHAGSGRRGAADLRECLLLQIESRGKGGVAWNIVSDHLKLVERGSSRNWRAAEASHGAYRGRDRCDPASGPAPGAALLRTGSAARWSRTSIFPKTAKTI